MLIFEKVIFIPPKTERDCSNMYQGKFRIFNLGSNVLYLVCFKLNVIMSIWKLFLFYKYLINKTGVNCYMF